MSGIGLKRFGKRAMVACLVLALSVMMVPSVAFGYENNYQETVDATSADATNNDIGNLADTSKYGGLRVEAANGHTATATAGDIEASESGLFVTVGEDNGGYASVTTGGVATSNNEQGWAGVNVSAYKDGKASVTVNGNVNAQYGAGVVLGTWDNGAIDFSADGYVTSQDGSGLTIINQSSSAGTGTVDALVTGEIFGTEYGVSTDFRNPGSTNTLTAWKITTGENGTLVDDDAFAKAINYIVNVAKGGMELQAAAVDTTSAGSEAHYRAAASADGTKLAQSHDFDVAREGDRVYIVADAGYKITKAYNADEEYYQAAKQDADGNWYIDVTRGGGINIQALVEAIAGTYKVIFQNEDKTELQSSTYEYNATPEYKGSTPTKADDDEYTYTFNGWTPAIAKVTADAVYTATYEKTAKEKPTPDPDEPADDPTGDNKAETKAASSSASASAGSSMPQTGDTLPVLPVMATLLVTAGALLVARRRVD